MTKFIIGKRYFHRFACDHDAMASYIVVKRTAKSLWVKNDSSEVIRKKINVYNISDDCEFIYPLGRYSMAPMLKASNTIK